MSDLQLKGEHIERLRRALSIWEVWLRCADKAIDAGDMHEAKRQIKNVCAEMFAEHQA